MSRWSESNRRPTPYHGVALPTELHRLARHQPLYFVFPFLKTAPRRPLSWSQRSESNRRPTVYKTVALPAELRWLLRVRAMAARLSGEACGQGGIRTPVAARAPDLQSGAIDRSATCPANTNCVSRGNYSLLSLLFNLRLTILSARSIKTFRRRRSLS